MRNNLTIVQDSSRYSILEGKPSSHALKPLAAYIYVKDNRVTVVWTVNCDPSDREIRTLVFPRLNGWERPAI